MMYERVVFIWLVCLVCARDGTQRSLDFGGRGTGFNRVLVVLGPDVLEILGERVDRLAVFVGD